MNLPKVNITDILNLLKLLPAIVIAIKALEEAIPQSGQGATKLGMLRGLLEIGDSAVTALWPMIERAVAIIIEGMNKAKTL